MSAGLGSLVERAERLNRNADETVADLLQAFFWGHDVDSIRAGARHMKERAAALAPQPVGWPFEETAR